jgi:hypothetical protein
MTESQPNEGTGSAPKNPVDPNSLLGQAEIACKQAGYETKWNDIEDKDGNSQASLQIAIPNGRYTRWQAVYDTRARFIIDHQISAATALGEYEAFLFKEDYEIEVGLRPLGPAPSTAISFRRMSMLPGIVNFADDESEDAPLRSYWHLPFVIDPDQDWSAMIGPASLRYSALSTRPGISSQLTLRISGIHVSRHDDALRVLEEVSGSILFELDLRYGIAVNIARISQLVRARRVGPDGRSSVMRRLPTNNSVDPPRLPRNTYPVQPLALYWYARSASNMPLLQYLASYQVLEYHFNTYYQRETLDRIKQELLDPRFSPQQDADLSRLIALASPQGRVFGSEREQLRATVRACVSAAYLEDYLKEPSRYDFFTGRQHVKDVTQLAFGSKAPDIRDQVSDRIYDIRCRIVHTKSDAKDRYPDLLLPFSEEAEALGLDIELIQYLAQRVLINRALPLRLP